MKLILAAFVAVLPPGASAQTFGNKPDLQNAADLWCSDETAALAAYGNIADWDVSRITDMSMLFCAEPWCANNGGGSTTGKATCNPDIRLWVTSAVTDMTRMFFGAISFDKDISTWHTTWHTSGVLYMTGMFYGATSFDKDISSWDTSAVRNMAGMFYGATSFDKDISSWDTSAVKRMTSMFNRATSFDKDISSWDTSAVLDMASMFYDATSLSDCNKALIHASFDAQTSAWPYWCTSWDGWWWCTSCPPPPASPPFPPGVAPLPPPPPPPGTFANKPDLQNAADLWCSNETAALAAHGNIADWDVSRITDMQCLFSANPWCLGGGSTSGKSTCNPDIGSWVTSAVRSMSWMFFYATSFNKDLSSWDVSAALYMGGMFDGATSLSDCNKALMHASFVAQTSAWKYSWGSLTCPPPASPPSLPPASPTGVCGDGTALDAVTRKCEVSLGNGTEVLDGKVEVVLGSATEVVDGKVEIACADNRRLEEAQEEGAQEAAAASIVDGLLARHPDFLAKLRRASDEEAIKMLLKLGQDFRLPALA